MSTRTVRTCLSCGASTTSKSASCAMCGGKVADNEILNKAIKLVEEAKMLKPTLEEVKALKRIFGKKWETVLNKAKSKLQAVDQLIKLGEIWGVDWEEPSKETERASLKMERLGFAFKSSDPNVGKWLTEAIVNLKNEPAARALVEKAAASLAEEKGCDEEKEYEYPKRGRKSADLPDGHPLAVLARGTPLGPRGEGRKTVGEDLPRGHPLEVLARGTPLGPRSREDGGRGQKVVKYFLEPDSAKAVKSILDDDQASTPHSRLPDDHPLARLGAVTTDELEAAQQRKAEARAEAHKALIEEGAGEQLSWLTCPLCGYSVKLQPSHRKGLLPDCVCGGPMTPTARKGDIDVARKATGRVARFSGRTGF